MAQIQDAQPGTEVSTQRAALGSLPPRYRWAAGGIAMAVVLAASLLIWGPEMDFPTTVSRQPSSDGTITLDRSVRDVTGRAINDAVKWITREGDWLFDGLSTAVTYAIINIEKTLKWLPWPAVVIGLALLSFVVGRWSLLVFTSLALLFVGFMDLWENMIDTVALMVVAVAVSMSIGLPLGVLGARSRMADNLMRPILDGMQTMPSFVYLLPGILFFGLGKPAGIFATIHIRRPAGNPPDQSWYPPGVRRDRRSSPGVRGVADADTHQGPDSHGPAHDHGGHQPDHDDGPGDGDHRQHGGRRRPG